MADETPDTPTPDSAAAPKKRAPKKSTPAKSTAAKSTASKPAAKKPAATRKAPAKAAATSSAATASAPTAHVAPAEHASAEPVATSSSTAAPATPAPAPRGSVLDSVRANTMGPATAALVVAIVVGLLLSVLVPDDPTVLALVILGAMLAAAVGFTTRYLVPSHSWKGQVAALVAAAIGVHLMTVTGMLGGELPLLSQFGAQGPTFNDALLAALATVPVSTGSILAGLTAAIIVGWGRSSDD